MSMIQNSNVALSTPIFQSAKISNANHHDYDRHFFELDFGLVGSHQIRRLRIGESLFLQGDVVRWIWLLQDGWAFRHQSLEDGRRQIVDFVLPGDIVGIEADGEMPYGVEALSNCTWSVVSRESYVTELAKDPALGLKTLNILGASQARAFDHLTSIGRRTARERVAHLLLDLARRTHISMAGKRMLEITMPLTLSHIGDSLGLATETVCRCLSQLKREQILTLSAGCLKILNLDSLYQLAGLGMDSHQMSKRLQ